MSGHSHWATTKHAKAKTDAARGKIFSRIAKEIMIAAKSNGDPNTNPALRTLIEKGRKANMPKDNIENAIKKGTGELAGAAAFEEINYEGFAAGGVGIIVNVLTDNKNRAAAEIGNIFKKNNSEFAKVGAVSRNFERKGLIEIDANGQDEDTIMMLALDAGADDVENTGDTFEISCTSDTFQAISDALDKAGIPTLSAEASTLVPMSTTMVSDLAVAKAVNKFVDALEDNDDVQNVYHNMELSDDVEKALEAEEGE